MDEIISVAPPPKLTNINVYLTWQCNFRCIHCWVEAGDEKGSQLDINRFFRFLDEAIPLGLSTVRMTGGEPLIMKKEVLRILDFGKQHGLRMEMETNGFLLNDELISKFKEAQIHLSISLNGHHEDLHDSFTKTPGSFQRVLQNIRKCVASDLDVEIITCTGRYNHTTFPETLTFLDSLGAKRIKINPVVDCGRADGTTGLVYDDQELIALYKDIQTQRRRLKTPILLMMPHCMEKFLTISQGYAGRCGGLNLLSYLPDNHIGLCGYAGINEDIIVDRYEEGSHVSTIWKNNPKILDMRKSFENRSGVCRICIHGSSCNSVCKAESVKEYHRWDAPYPFCQRLYDSNQFPESRLIKGREKEGAYCYDPR